MNERIRLLAEQCYETGPIGKDGWPEYSKFNEEKFAELIVWDCIEAIDAKEYTMGGDTEAMGMRFSINIIKKHFGVEE